MQASCGVIEPQQRHMKYRVYAHLGRQLQSVSNFANPSKDLKKAYPMLAQLPTSWQWEVGSRQQHLLPNYQLTGTVISIIITLLL